MFERYTEKARRVIFFARYEASQFGQDEIETEHILLGLLREDPGLCHRFKLSEEIIRKQIEGVTVVGEKVPTSVDMPLSSESKRVLANCAEEAEVLGHKHIGTEHVLMGLLREEKSFAAELLHGAGLRLENVRETLSSSPVEGPAPKPPGISVSSGQFAPMIEFVEDGKPLTITTLFVMLPRAGEEVILSFAKGPRTFRVENVRYIFINDPHFQARDGQRLEKIQVLIKPMST